MKKGKLATEKRRNSKPDDELLELFLSFSSILPCSEMRRPSPNFGGASDLSKQHY
jgi:hypothetical protein